METPACAYCKEKWSYTETLKNNFRLSMICPHCGKENYFMPKEKSGNKALMILPIVILIGVFIDISIEWLIAISVVLISVHLLLFPFKTRLKKPHQ
ncbi:TIGR04104 family putative zinc finger protein [Oceanobacillus sp. CF4.6]|uniref:TIGR04104 family putative zinc finger protein n=1 Tax=Oceanobacillus sp. CF4.6 TaxID=3373080 RepID=UPI003EE42C36